jgi:hypothetical protein
MATVKKRFNPERVDMLTFEDCNDVLNLTMDDAIVDEDTRVIPEDAFVKKGTLLYRGISMRKDSVLPMIYRWCSFGITGKELHDFWLEKKTKAHDHSSCDVGVSLAEYFSFPDSSPFISTTTDRNRAFKFAMHGWEKRDGRLAVLLTLTAPENQGVELSKIFPNSDLAQKEKEVTFIGLLPASSIMRVEVFITRDEEDVFPNEWPRFQRPMVEKQNYKYVAIFEPTEKWAREFRRHRSRSFYETRKHSSHLTMPERSRSSKRTRSSKRKTKLRSAPTAHQSNIGRRSSYKRSYSKK